MTRSAARTRTAAARGLARLLALLLLVGWGAATAPHGRALAALAGALPVQLCTAHGLRTVLMGGDGRPLAPEEAADCCVLCLGPGAAPPPGQAASPRPPSFARMTATPLRPGLPPPPPRAPPQLPRAPPTA